MKIGSGKPKYFFIADQLDGTRTSLEAFHFTASLALSKVRKEPRLSDVIAGLVMDIPNHEIFSAIKGEFKEKNKNMRRQLCYVAEGRIDAVIDARGVSRG